MLTHHIHQSQGSCDVVVIVLPRLLHRFADSLQPCKVNDCIRLFRIKYLVQTLAVTDIHLIKGNLLPCDGFYSSENLFTCVVEIVQNDRLMPCILQLHYSMTSDKTCTACYKNLHCLSPPVII